MYCIRSAAFGSSKTNLFEVILYIIETFVPILRSYRVQKHTINKTHINLYNIVDYCFYHLIVIK